ncbi:MAG: MMPL family transporter [Sinobacteraceae bacterium]|nr:MMPL family transporter [Rhodobiaceae bacterium]MCC0041398.1 MMPL family transporter [Rhodobiaceae bacterium]MCP5360996.1 MMPL family transporter [Nevskiaceae bacterium]
MSIARAVNRLGLAALAWPRTCLGVLVAATLAMAAAIPGIETNSDIREIYRSQSADFATYERASALFPASETDTYLVLTGKDLLNADALQRLRELHLELNFVDGVSHVLSPFSARGRMRGDEVPPPLLPLDLVDGPDLDAAIEELMQHPFGGKLLVAPDRTAVEFIIAETGMPSDIDQAIAFHAAISEVVGRVLAGSGIDFQLAGLQATRVEILGALVNDQLVFMAGGLGLALAIAFVLFRDLRYVAIAATPAIMAIAWLLGAMALAGRQLTVMSNMAPTLVLVIALSGTIHFLCRIRQRTGEGYGIETAIADAVRRVGPACLLSSATTAVGLMSLTFSGYDFVIDFGYAVAAGACLAFVATILAVPALARLLLAGREVAAAPVLDAALPRIAERMAAIALAHSVAIVVAGTVLTAACTGLFFLAKPGFRNSENLPAGSPTLSAMNTINAKLAGTASLVLVVTWPDAANWDIAKAAAVSSEAQKAFAADPDIRAVTSLGRVVDQMSGQDAGQRAHLLRLIDEGAVDFTSRLVNPGALAIAVTAFLDDVDSQHLVERQGAWNAIVARLRAAHPEADFELTGLSLVAANGGTEMISALKRSLVGAICVIFTLIAAWLGSLRLGLVSLPPNIAPIAIASAPIYLSETGIQFSVIIAFTVGFGIAVDDTIHFLNRYRDRGAGASVRDRITDAVHAVGVPMIVSSLVLLTGISVTLLSQLPMVRLFGQISMLVVASALAADLLFLPALLNLRRRGAGDPASDNSEKTT